MAGHGWTYVDGEDGEDVGMVEEIGEDEDAACSVFGQKEPELEGVRLFGADASCSGDVPTVGLGNENR